MLLCTVESLLSLLSLSLCRFRQFVFAYAAAFSLFTCKVLFAHLFASPAVVYCGFHHPFCLFISRAKATPQAKAKRCSGYIFTRRLFYVVSNKLPTPHAHPPLLNKSAILNIKHKYCGTVVSFASK